jgi:hypothetical protein
MLVKFYQVELKEAGLLSNGKTVADYYWHGVSHMLGLDTHDVSIVNYELQEGNVFTVEPGLYIEEENPKDLFAVLYDIIPIIIKSFPEDGFTMDDLYLTTIMMYTDYYKTLGNANISIYVKLAKDWLMDKDVSVKGSEKLASYYENIVK